MNLITKFYTRTKRYGLRYVLHIILQNKVYRHLDSFVFSLSKIIWRNAPLKDIIIMESHNDFDSNDGAFFTYLVNNGFNRKYKIVWLLRNKKPKQLPPNVYGYNIFRPSFRKAYYICSAKFITYDHVPIEKVKEGQKVGYLTHGPFGLKAFKGMIKLSDRLDFILCPSHDIAPLLADQYMIPYPNNKQVFLGFPMHDVFYDHVKGDLDKITTKTYKKTILWMPTFRKTIGFHRIDSSVESPLGIPIFDKFEEVEELNGVLSGMQALMIIKIHPMQDMTTVKLRNLSNVVVLDGKIVKEMGIDNYRLMKDVDALISDYSSVAYDFLHLDRPIAYTMDDLQYYNAGLIVDDPRQFMAGHIIQNQADLMQFIEDILMDNDRYRDERRKLLDKVFMYHDGNSCKRLAEYMGL